MALNYYRKYHDDFHPVGSHTHNASLGTAVTLTIPNGANAIMMQSTTNDKDIRFTIDGTVPTSSNGFVMTSHIDPPLLLRLGDGVVLKVIDDDSGAAIDYQFLRIE
jgi:hypothetical protein